MADAAAPWNPRVPWWVQDLIAMALVVSLQFLPLPVEFGATTPLTIVATVVAAIALPLRRRFAIPALAVCVVLYGVATVSGTLAAGVLLAAMIATFGVANRSTRRVTLLVGSIAFLAILLLSIPGVFGALLDPRGTYLAVWIAAAAAAGDATRSRREYIAAIMERAQRAEQSREAEARRRVSEERLRIARDLHDTVAHQISVISLSAGAAATSLESDPAKARESLASIRSAARTVLGEIGSLLSLLRSEDGTAAPRAPEPGIDRLDELADEFRQAGLDVRLRVDGDVADPADIVGQVSYRVVQEGLTNALKHGSERRAEVVVEGAADQLRISITNPAPRGGRAADRSGFGLLGLRERVAAVQGVLETERRAGAFRLGVTIPRGGEPA